MFTGRRLAPTDDAKATIVWWTNTLLLQSLLIAFGLLEFVEGYPTFRPLTVSGGLSLGLALGCVLLRSRAPWLFFGALVAMNFFFTLEVPARPAGWSLVVAQPFAVYAAASRTPARLAVPIITGGLALLVATAWIARGVTFPNVYPVTMSAFVLSALALGQMTYLQRQLVGVSVQRAEEAERTREALTAKHLAQQRLRTARDLHDVVGHEIAIINIHAGAAAKAVTSAPGEALRSLSVIEQSATRMMAEIGELLRTLRGEVPPPPLEDVALDSVRRLSHTLSAGGLPIDLRIARDVSPVSPEIGETIEKIMEEALVNAYKHGAREQPATARVQREGGEIVLRVSNPVDPSEPPAATSSSTALGVIGIRERVASRGGTVEIQHSATRYTLTARLPSDLP